MNRSALNWFVAIVAAVSTSASAADVNVHDAWIKEAPPGMDMLAGYMDVENTGDKEIRITQVTSRAAADVMMHKSEVVDGVAHMTHLDAAVVPPHSHLLFKPESYHLMIMGLKCPLKDGDKVDLQLHTDDGQKIDATATVRHAE